MKTQLTGTTLKAYLVQYQWDPAKSEWTLRVRQFDFEFASTIFNGFVVELVDDRRDYGERRVRAIGQANGRFLHVVYTDRGDVRRIISARRANAKEIEEWRKKNTWR